MARLAHGEAEAILADGCAGMDSDMVTDQGVGYRGIRADIAVPADMHAVTDDAAGCNCRPLPDACLGPDHRPRLNTTAWLKSGGLFHLQAAAGGGLRLERIGVKQEKSPREASVGLGRHKARRGR